MVKKKIASRAYRGTSKKQPNTLSRKKLSLLVFVGLFAIIGVVVLFRSFAATTVGSLESEAMTMTSTSTVVADSAASGSKAVQLTKSEPLSGTLTLSAQATNIVLRARGVQCKGAPQAVVTIDGKQALVATVSATSWTQYNAAQTLAAGNHPITVAFANPGSVGKKCSRSLTVDVVQAIDNSQATPTADTTAPTTNLASPTNGSTVAGIVAVKANASDNAAVTKVEFYIDSKLVGSVTASPYSYSWDTSTATNASHTLVSKAYDAAGNSASSASVLVSVNNVPPTTSPSGVAMPVGDVTSGGHTWRQVLTEDFTKDAALGSWNDSGTLTSCPSNADAALYTGATGTRWASYPKCYKDTNQKRNYRPDQVLSVHDGTLDFWLHTVDGHPAGANPGPIMPDSTRYQTYGRYEARFRITTSSLSTYYTAWLLWPKNDADWQCAESDFPENQLSITQVNAFAHYGCSGSQDHYYRSIDKTQWHTYTQEWMPGKRNYYLDGTLIGSSTNQVYTGLERWQLQTETNTNCDSTTAGCPEDGHLLVDWAVVYAY